MKHCRTYHDIFGDFLPSGKKICINQGGSRSGKTYSILEVLIEIAIKAHIMKMEGLVITICRKTFPALRATAMRDFFTILKSINLYDERRHNISISEYQLYETTFEFISLDQPQKVRGRKRNILFCNELNELTFEDWRQLLMRTTDKVFGDFNPSDEFHWIYDNVLTRNDVSFYITTYKDNPHLEQSIIDEIERYQTEDLNYWKIYGLGERGVSGATILINWTLVDSIPEGGNRAYGTDFGYNNPSSLIECVKHDEGLYVDEWVYQSHLTNNALISKMNEIGISKRQPDNCDNAEPDRIEEIRRAGYNAIPAKKEVKPGLDKLKSVPIFITKRSVNLVKEIKSYKYKVDSSGNPIADDPVKLNDHAMDAMRYGSYDLIVERKFKFRVAKMV